MTQSTLRNYLTKCYEDRNARPRLVAGHLSVSNFLAVVLNLHKRCGAVRVLVQEHAVSACKAFQTDIALLNQVIGLRVNDHASLFVNDESSCPIAEVSEDNGRLARADGVHAWANLHRDAEDGGNS